MMSSFFVTYHITRYKDGGIYKPDQDLGNDDMINVALETKLLRLCMDATAFGASENRCLYVEIYIDVTQKCLHCLRRYYQAATRKHLPISPTPFQIPEDLHNKDLELQTQYVVCSRSTSA